ncbi:MAG: FHA domain-containing protein [Myxococcaceae bacterium]
MKKAAVELPFDDGEVTPLQADDPRPQRVPQFPSNGAARKAPRKAEEAIPTSVYEVKQQDEEFQPSYEDGSHSDPGFKPAFLYVERGPGAGQLVPVRQGLLIIGRASVSELRLQHPSISRRHAQITRKGEFFYVKDLGSQNGTYVNRQKLDTEVEVQPGDEIACGNALLKLRGPVQAADSASVSVAMPRPKRKATSGAVKVALFAGAVGFGLAAVMMFALLHSQKPSYQELPSKKPVSKTDAPLLAAKKSDSPVVITEDEVSVKIQKLEKEAQAKKAAQQNEQQAEVEPAVAKVEKESPVSAVAMTKGQVKKTPEPKKVAMVTSSKKSSAKEEDAEDDSSAKASPSGARGAIMARYEAGNVGAAIELAKKAGDSELVGKLEKFQSAYDAAKDAVDSNNTNGAVKNYEAALKIDKTLSSGWGKYGTEIQRELGRIYALGGNAFLKGGDESNAKKAFSKALSYDPNNNTAKNGLAQLGGDDEKPVASKRAAIADACADDEAPAPKKKAAPKAKAEKPAGKRAAIDDAFGD